MKRKANDTKAGGVKVKRVNISVTNSEHAIGKEISRRLYKGRFSAWVAAMIVREGKRLGIKEAA